MSPLKLIVLESKIMCLFLEPHSTQCCSPEGQLLENANIPEHCFPIVIPKGDPLLTKYNINCMNFVRTITDRDRNCVGGQKPAEQVHYSYFPCVQSSII